MNKLCAVLVIGVVLSACSDENMEKWREMNKDRIQEAPIEDPNLPTVQGDIEAVKQSVREINDAVHDKVEQMLETKKE